MATEIGPELQGERRVAIRYVTVNVPGQPINRAKQVADDFASWKLQRRFSYDKDFIHCDSDFDSEESKNVWILCDFNVRKPVPRVETVPLEFWKVRYVGPEATFSRRSSNAQHFTNLYPWGGRENEWNYRLQVSPEEEKAALSLVERQA